MHESSHAQSFPKNPLSTPQVLLLCFACGLYGYCVGTQLKFMLQTCSNECIIWAIDTGIVGNAAHQTSNVTVTQDISKKLVFLIFSLYEQHCSYSLRRPMSLITYKWSVQLKLNHHQVSEQLRLWRISPQEHDHQHAVNRSTDPAMTAGTYDKTANTA